MPFQLLDLILIGIMIISGLLALMRGFTREVLSLVAWGVAALAALGLILSPELLGFAQQYLQPEIVAKIALAGGVFLIVLIVMSLISVRIADWVLDSAAGAFDRSLGFVYGVARGLLLVVIAYLFYIWLVPKEKHEDWIRTARLLPVVEEVGTAILAFLPADIADVLRGKTYISTQQPVPAAPPESTEPTQQIQSPASEQEEDGYQAGQQRNLNQLIEGTEGGTADRQPDAAPEAEPTGEAPDAGGQPVFGGQGTTDP
ncbi:MAG: CvpA family protein [Pseudomonadota bacterium]|nr:CvpA family protein [Pseudomonadota bacterium]